MKDLISVIVPVYNVEPFISSCLDSLSKQIYQNFEVLLVNDGSTDNSGAICREYADRDSRFHYFEKENAGVADARNFGIERSKGDYITFVDSDDWVTEEYLSILIETLKELKLLFQLIQPIMSQMAYSIFTYLTPIIM